MSPVVLGVSLVDSEDPSRVSSMSDCPWCVEEWGLVMPWGVDWKWFFGSVLEGEAGKGLVEISTWSEGEEALILHSSCDPAIETFLLEVPPTS